MYHSLRRSCQPQFFQVQLWRLWRKPYCHRKDTGVCYAFVEFEDVQSVQNAIKASPIQLAGRKVYIEERRPNSTTSRGGRSGGRGRGGRGGRASGRGSEQNDSDGKRVRANGFRGA
ncbi:UNVERIFIED_CONTAM: hypothetical protein Sangu_0358800 [Sesamum angustifolium]|uniref:RRM domain-containing protein n=1 Tax=Sesamum angustifolium TaxID=2727405 RepID=A0AAW2QQZ0_9LAMI